MSTPTPSLQSVAEAAAREIDTMYITEWAKRTQLPKIGRSTQTLTCHFAPLLAQYEQRVRELEGENRELSDANASLAGLIDEFRFDTEGDVHRTPSEVLLALRTRCAELEEDKAALVEAGSELDAALVKCTHLTGESETLDLERAKLKFRAAIAARTKETAP